MKFKKFLMNKADSQSYSKDLDPEFPPGPHGISCNILSGVGELILSQKSCVLIFILNTERGTKSRN